MIDHDEHADEVDRLRAEAAERGRALVEAQAENAELRRQAAEATDHPATEER